MALLTPISTVTAQTSPSGASEGQARTGATELRIALVCDGGVSLAIYEHGITKELQNVVIASRAFDDIRSGLLTQEQADDALSPVHRAYLRALQANQAHPLTVVIDVISGTSAGGINGVCLAKAISCNGSQDPLTELWMEKASIAKLAHRPLGSMLGSLRAMMAIRRNVVEPGWSPFDGDLLSQWVFEALTKMDEVPATPGAPSAPKRASLVPDGQTIDLFVTTTDLRGYDRIIPSPDGGAGDQDRVNRKAFHFSSAVGDTGQFQKSDNAGLAFVARCTSSFPGAFQPSNLQVFSKAVHGFNAAGFTQQQLAEYELVHDDVMEANFSDGGLLDNSPFDLMIGAISAKSAQTEVLRTIVHINPDPSEWESSPGDQPIEAAQTRPSYVGGIVKALRVRKSQSLVADLLQVQKLNDEIDQIGRITLNLETRIADYLKPFYDARDGVDPTWAEAQTWAPNMFSKVPESAGTWNAETYNRLKIGAVAQMMASDLAEALGYPAATQQAECIRSALSEWMEGDSFWAERSAEQVTAFLDQSDMPYRERRFRFLIAQLNKLYGTPPFVGDPQAINLMKAAAWTALQELFHYRAAAARELVTTTAAFLRPQSLTQDAATDPTRFLQAHQSEFSSLVTSYAERLAQYKGGAALTSAFEAAKGDAAISRMLIRSYLWFPLWDAVVYPIIALSSLPQLTPITIQRFSPRDASLLAPLPGAKPRKLEGTRFSNFGGFLDRKWRENDYLWGRLDAAELIMKNLGQSGMADPTRELFGAILDEETPKLTHSRELIDHVRRQVTG